MRKTLDQMTLEAILNGQSLEPLREAADKLMSEMNGDTCPSPDLECHSTNIEASGDQFLCMECGHLWWQPEHDPERDWEDGVYCGEDEGVSS